MSPSSERGQTAAEYAVVLTLISAGIVLAVAVLSGAESALFQHAADVITGIF
jgi:Flp pilus assembly pilin Flp